jgi:hypothetical protein
MNGWSALGLSQQESAEQLSIPLERMTPPLLALEEHYYSAAIFSSIGETFQRTLQGVPGLADQLRSLGDGRLEAMNRGNISLQVVSHAFTPGQ